MEDEPLATIEFPHGDRIFMGKDRRWHGENSKFVQLTNNLMDRLSQEKRADWSYDIAHEIAAAIGAKVIQAVKHKHEPPLPGDAD